jgi:hypothetical protein
MMVPPPAAEGLCQRRDLAPQPPFGPRGHGGRIGCLAINAASIARPEPPIISVASAANFMVARSKTP